MCWTNHSCAVIAAFEITAVQDKNAGRQHLHGISEGGQQKVEVVELRLIGLWRLLLLLLRLCQAALQQLLDLQHLQDVASALPPLHQHYIPLYHRNDFHNTPLKAARTVP